MVSAVWAASTSALVGQRDADRWHLRFAAAQAVGQGGDGLLGRGAGLEVELVAGGVDVGSRAGAGQADVGALGGREVGRDHVGRVGRLALRRERVRHVRQAGLRGVEEGLVERALSPVG